MSSRLTPRCQKALTTQCALAITTCLAENEHASFPLVAADEQQLKQLASERNKRTCDDKTSAIGGSREASPSNCVAVARRVTSRRILRVVILIVRQLVSCTHAHTYASSLARRNPTQAVRVLRRVASACFLRCSVDQCVAKHCAYARICIDLNTHSVRNVACRTQQKTNDDSRTEKRMFFLSWLTARGSGTVSVCLITDTLSPVRIDWSTRMVVE